MSSQDVHPLLLRQAERAGGTAFQPPDAGQWSAFLAKVSAAYRAAEDDRYLLELLAQFKRVEVR